MIDLREELPIMAGPTEQAARTDISPLRSWIVRHPITTFLVLVYATTTALVFVPQGLTEPGLLPGGATPHGVLVNVLGSAVPAFIVTALVSGKAGVRDLARRSFRWRVPLRWYLISLLTPLLIFLIAVTILYGAAPLRALAENWLLLFTRFLLALLIMILLNNVAEEIGWTGFVFARFQDRHVRCAPPCSRECSSRYSTFRASMSTPDHGRPRRWRWASSCSRTWAAD
jgi:membrane protease YdiL (CAAX protease family)